MNISKLILSLTGACALSLTAQAQNIFEFGFEKPHVVPDNQSTGTFDIRNLTNAPAIIGDIKVRLRLNGDFNGDLYVTLAHESGFAVLLNRVGTPAGAGFGYDDPGFNIVLDDAAANGDIHSYRLSVFGNEESFLTNSLTGSWAPDGRNVEPMIVTTSDVRTALLDSFKGLNANGAWTLFLADLSGGGTTQLEGWGLEITPSPVALNTIHCQRLLVAGQEQLRLFGTASAGSLVEVSTDLVNWTAVSTNAAAGQYEYFELVSGYPQRYFRTRSAP